MEAVKVLGQRWSLLQWNMLYLVMLSIMLLSWLPSLGGMAARMRGQRSTDIHGGVKMGISSEKCDDAKTNLTIDGDPRFPGIEERYRCTDEQYLPVQSTLPKEICQTKAALPIHKCMSEPIVYPDNPPLSGAHRPLWPVYGEYLYLPPQRWLHSMEHGAVVMLYHPCADPGEVDRLRLLVTSCIRRHIITPYTRLSPQQPLALLAWTCKLTMSYVDEFRVEKFIKERGILPAPEASVSRDGQFNVSLIAKAKVVSDFEDSKLCPPRKKKQWQGDYPFDMWLEDLEQFSYP